jgi:hypothetical protein
VLVAWLFVHGDGTRRGPGAGARDDVFVRTTPSEALLAASGGTVEREAVAAPIEPTRDASTPSEPPGPIEGRLSLDGSPPPPGARVVYRSADGEREGWAPLDPGGRFRIEAPAMELVLDFEVQAASPRLLLLPRQEAKAAPGAATRLDLDWRTLQVNLRVVGAADGWNQASVHLTGPGHDDRFATGDDGKAGLDLVGSGLYRFEAVHPTGRRGEATLELQPDAELESVLVTLRDSR